MWLLNGQVEAVEASCHKNEHNTYEEISTGSNFAKTTFKK